MNKIYLAGPLFSDAEREWGSALKQRIHALAIEVGKEVEIIWPYELITKEEIEGLGDFLREEIFTRCKTHLMDTTILVVNLDGSQVDDGTAWEAGYFYASKSSEEKMIGIRTDFRRAGESSGAVVNAMIERSCDEIVFDVEDLIDILRKMLLEK